MSKDYNVRDAKGNEWSIPGDAKVHCEQCGKETKVTVEQHHAMPSPRPKVYCEACEPNHIN